MLLALVLSGCQTASEAAHGAAMATSQGYAAAVTAGKALTQVLPAGAEGASLEDQREAMRRRAGPERFRNPELVQAREGLDQRKFREPDALGFQAAQAKMRNPAFGRLRAALRNGRSGVDFTGSAKDRAGLEGAVGEALPVAIQPILAEVLPAFVK